MRMLIAVALLAALLAGCSDESEPEDAGDEPLDTGTNDGTSTATDTNGSSPPPARDPVTWDISIAGNDFVDGSISIQVGDTVRWTHNDGAVPHTVTADNGEFDSDNGATNRMTATVNNVYSFTFDVTGEYPYFCEVHPNMRDTITVLERLDATPTAA